jgi:hypothetical protein
VLSRSLPRFLLQAGLLIGVAAIAAVLHLDAWAIVVVMAAAFGGVVCAEWLTTRGAGARTVSAATATAVAEPVPEPAPVPEPKPIAAPPPKRPRPKGTPLLRPPGARRWNVFDLQNRARSIAGADSARDEEFTFLLLYLREFADVAGDLSDDFDGFVRESLPELIASG